MPLRHELAHTLTYTRYTVLSCTIFYRLLFVLCGLCAFPLHLSPLASIKAAPASYWNQTADSREESTLFRARLQDLLMVMGARLACQPKLRRLPALAFRGAINVEGAGLSQCPFGQQDIARNASLDFPVSLVIYATVCRIRWTLVFPPALPVLRAHIVRTGLIGILFTRESGTLLRGK